MQKYIQNILILILMSFIPLLIGVLVNFTIMYTPMAPYLYLLLSLVTLGFVFLIGRLAKKMTNKPVIALLAGNAVSTVNVILVIIQTFVLGHFFVNIWGTLSQFNFISLTRLVVVLDVFNLLHSMSLIMILSYIIIMIVYYIGYRTASR